MILPKFIYRLNSAYWRIIKPTTVGVRIMLIRQNSILLVKHTYHDSWYLPGGGVKKGETFEQAIRREASEELDCDLKCIKLFGVYNNFKEHKNDNIIIFYSNDFSVNGKKSFEIEKYGYFPLDDLPDKISKGTYKRINEYLSGHISNFGLW